MSLNLEEKKEVVAEVSKTIESAQAMILAEYRGVGVGEMTTLRALNVVISPTPTPRYSASIIAWALSIVLLTSATTSFFSSRFRLKVFSFR